MGAMNGTHRLSMGLASVVGTALMVLVGCGDEPKTTTVIRPVKTMVLDSASSAVRRSYPGTVQASQRAVLAFKVAGPLVEFSVAEGQEVEEGAVLARIDPRDFKTRLADETSSLAEAQATLRAMETARPEDIRLLEAQLAAATATLQEAEGQLNRNQVLVKNRVVTQAAFDQIVAAHDVAKAKMEAAQENLQKAKAGSRKEDVEAMQARIAGLQAQVDAAQNAFEGGDVRGKLRESRSQAVDSLAARYREHRNHRQRARERRGNREETKRCGIGGHVRGLAGSRIHRNAPRVQHGSRFGHADL